MRSLDPYRSLSSCRDMVLRSVERDRDFAVRQLERVQEELRRSDPHAGRFALRIVDEALAHLKRGGV